MRKMIYLFVQFSLWWALAASTPVFYLTMSVPDRHVGYLFTFKASANDTTVGFVWYALVNGEVQYET